MLEEFEAKEGPEAASRMAEGWRRDGWPGPLTPENEAVMEWAYAAAALGVEAADRAYPARTMAGNEGGVVTRRAIALGFVKHRAHEEATRRVEAERKERDGR